MQNNDLNKILIDEDDRYPFDTSIQSKSEYEHERRKQIVESMDKTVEVYFDDLENRLIQHIEQFDAIVGCVAWLTHEGILSTLSKRKAVSIIVQKEDFLRPDLQSNPNWSFKLRRLYDSLNEFWRPDLGELAGYLSTSHGSDMGAIRCVGNYNQDKVPAFPRAHHKFVVFGKLETDIDDVDHEWENWEYFHPYAVWTGSFNFTHNATQSFENALYITDKNIVNAYHREFQYMLALSESLDWESVWVAPEYRIGT